MIAIVALCLLCSRTYAGSNGADPASTKIDAAAPLAKMLTARCTTDRQKVEAIFDWIVNNISYQVRPWNTRHNQQGNQVDDPSDTAGVLKPLNERVADLVIRRREAYCDGYARLFKTLCDYSGIQSHIITGYSNVNGVDRSGKKFKSNHTWNAVMIDSTWHLLDVTWASGFISYSNNQYVRQYNQRYFLAPPQQFVYDHYPEDLQWTLLARPPLLREFEGAPFRQQGFIRTQIQGYSPQKGVVEAIVGDTLYFELQTRYNLVSAVHDTITEPFNEASALQPVAFASVSWLNLQPYHIQAGRVVYQYVVTGTEVEYLNLLYAGNIVLRYRLAAKPLPGNQPALPGNSNAPIALATGSTPAEIFEKQ